MMEPQPEITPALTPEEWQAVAKELSRGNVGAASRTLDILRSGQDVDEQTTHAEAALALHGQPFGFTWDDVDEIRMQAREVENKPPSVEADPVLEHLADRIAALLPPRDGDSGKR